MLDGLHYSRLKENDLRQKYGTVGRNKKHRKDKQADSMVWNNDNDSFLTYVIVKYMTP